MKKAFLIVFVCLLALPAVAADRADKREIIRQARDAYYSLRQKGLDSFQVNADVNWDVVFRGQNVTVEQKEAAKKILNGLHFGIAFGADGKTVVTPRADTPPADARQQANFNQIFSGMNDVVTGFMDTYKPYMVGSPFPAVNYEYTLEDFNNGYKLTYQEGDANIITTMSKSLIIIEVVVHAPDFDSSIRPSFLATPEGMVLASYDGDYRPTKTTTGVTKLKVTIDHGIVDGLRLPAKVALDAIVDGVANASELTLTGYSVRKK